MSGNQPIGELFTRIYTTRGQATSDSNSFRVRLGAYIVQQFRDAKFQASNYLKLEGGVEIPIHGTYVNFPAFFEKAPLGNVLNAITLLFCWLEVTASYARSRDE
jgi:hypothetical protein